MCNLTGRLLSVIMKWKDGRPLRGGRVNRDNNDEMS